jgi:adenosylcobinamide hydrolase
VLKETRSFLFDHRRIILTRDFEYLMVEWDEPLTVLSSALWGGGLRKARRLINRHVPKDYCEDDPRQEARQWLIRHGWHVGETVALLTAARLADAQVRVTEGDRFHLATVVTAGVSNAARAGKAGPTYLDYPRPGTINMMLIVDGELTDAAMVNAVITASEAKAAALQELKVRDSEGDLATGTTTDAVIVASTQQAVEGVTHHYAGVASPFGQILGREVYHAVRSAVQLAQERKGEIIG